MTRGSLGEEQYARLSTFQERLGMVRSPATAESYTRGATLLERFFVEQKVVLSRATPGMLDDFVHWLLKRGITSKSTKLMTIGARRYLDWRRRNGEEFPELELPDVPTKDNRIRPIVVLSTNQLASYLGVVCTYPDPLRTMMLLLPMTGLRSAEITDIELHSVVSRPDIPLALSVMGKGSKPRIVPVGAQGRKILKQYLDTWRAQRRSDVEWLFPGKGDRPIRDRSLRKAIDWVAVRMKIPLLHPHVLRRTYVTYLAERGVPTLMIAQLIGHGKPLESDAPSITKRYQQSDLVTLSKVVEKIKFPAPVFPEAS